MGMLRVQNQASQFTMAKTQLTEPGFPIATLGLFHTAAKLRFLSYTTFL